MEKVPGKGISPPSDEVNNPTATSAASDPSSFLISEPPVSTIRSFMSSRRDSKQSDVSFKNWHKRMQAEHDIQGPPVFRIWKWCYKGCVVCRWFDSIPYEVKLCKWCFKFKTFKAIGTSFFISAAVCIYIYANIIEGYLPGPSTLFLLAMLGSSYTLGFLMSFAGIPSMIGYLLTGFLFKNSPLHTLLEYDIYYIDELSWNVERFYLLIALVRAGLLLNLARIKNSVRFIFSICLIPLVTEFIIVILASHTFFMLPMEWCALQSSLLCLVSLATITSVMEKNRTMGYGEDKNLSTVLIAAAAFSVLIGIFINTMIFSYIYLLYTQKNPTFVELMLYIGLQILVGLCVGFTTGLIAAFFPDKHNENASFLRIILIGIGALAIYEVTDIYEMTAAGVLGTMTFCITASNMWEEIGWHEYHNPVQYFYSKIYYLGQPIALTLIGFSVDFLEANFREIGFAFFIIFLGLSGREFACFLTTLGGIYPTNMKENLFICIAWFSKGTFQALLVFTADHEIEGGSIHAHEKDVEIYQARVKIVKETTVMAILIATPMAYYGLTLLSPLLLTKAPTSTQAIPPAIHKV